jgi:hypothetical protein
MTQPRAAAPTISAIDRYANQYRSIFPEVRSYEAFKRILIAYISLCGYALNSLGLLNVHPFYSS